jgi:hypothetical protein
MDDIKPTVASAPFDDPNADHVFTIQSSDSVQFHAHRYMLLLASPLFKDMLSLPQPTVSGEPNRAEVLELPENSVVLHTLLSCCDPRTHPDLASLQLDAVVATLHGGIKYQIKCVGPILLPQIKAHIPKVPLRVYAIAIQGMIAYKGTEGMETAFKEFCELARGAAKELLKYRIPFKSIGALPIPSEFEQVPSRYLENLYTYHVACGNQAAKLTRDTFMSPWCPRKFDMWKCTDCKTRITYRSDSSLETTAWTIGKWWDVFTKSAADALQRTPHPDIMVSRAFFNLDGENASSSSTICSVCTMNYYKTVPKHCQLLIDELTKELNKVHSWLPFLYERLSS